MRLSCCLWGLSERPGATESDNMEQLAHLGFEAIDICPSMQKSAQAKTKLKELKLQVGCISISHEAPAGSTFDTDDEEQRNPLIRHTTAAINHASETGAVYTYVVPGSFQNDSTYGNYAEHYAQLAEHAQSQGVKLGIEHFPGTAFPSVLSTLDFIKDVDHPNLYLLFDIGHAQISNEDPAKVLPLAGDRLRYVHLDDNDGQYDLHLALTDGVQTGKSLAELFSVLKDIGYDGFVSLEMHPQLPDPLAAIRRSKELIDPLLY